MTASLRVAQVPRATGSVAPAWGLPISPSRLRPRRACPRSTCCSPLRCPRLPPSALWQRRPQRRQAPGNNTPTYRPMLAVWSSRCRQALPSDPRPAQAGRGPRSYWPAAVSASGPAHASAASLTAPPRLSAVRVLASHALCDTLIPHRTACQPTRRPSPGGSAHHRQHRIRPARRCPARRPSAPEMALACPKL